MSAGQVDLRLGARARQVLVAIIESYIETGEPVASQTIARLYQDRGGMSSATIRNVMAELSDMHLLEQPHTSAGRVPTPLAFRFYVDQHLKRPERGDLSPASREQIQSGFTDVHTLKDFMERSSHVLASFSGGVGVAMSSTGDDAVLEHIHLSRVAPGQVLAVLVTKAGTVQDRVLRLERDIASGDLEASSRYLNENFRGWNIARIRTELAARVAQDRDAYDRLRQSLGELAEKGVFDSVNSAPTIYMEGVANLVATETNRGHLQQMLAALEEKQRIISLLNAYVGARTETVRVVVGLEDSLPESHGLVLIAAPAKLSGSDTGTVAIIGPTRMQYESAIGAVQYISQLLEKLLQPDEQPGRIVM
jgi:heat-inducible transcriptional repressor